MFSRVLLHRLESVITSPKIVMGFLEEFARLLPHLKHPCRRQSEHFCYSRNLIVFRGPWEQWEPQEELHYNAAQGPHVDGG